MGEEIFNLKICEILVNCGFKGNYIDLNFTDSGIDFKTAIFQGINVYIARYSPTNWETFNVLPIFD